MKQRIYCLPKSHDWFDLFSRSDEMVKPVMVELLVMHVCVSPVVSWVFDEVTLVRCLSRPSMDAFLWFAS